MLAMLLALTTLFVGIGTLSQNPTSGGYQLFERAASGISADIRLASLGNFGYHAKIAPECCNANDTGYNVSPAAWDNYPTIGRDGTYLTDEAAITDILGPMNSGGETVISAAQASQLELAMGLQRGSLSDGFKIRRVTGINAMSPRSPTVGNEYFLGAGQHLPGGGPEMVVNAIPTVDSQGVTTITSVVIR